MSCHGIFFDSPPFPVPSVRPEQEEASQDACSEASDTDLLNLDVVLSNAAELSQKTRETALSLASDCSTQDAALEAACPCVSGMIWHVARTAQGSREIQALLEEQELSSDSRMQLSLELQGHVIEAMRCPHANHVLQKFIVLLGPPCSSWVIEEIMQNRYALLAARHRYGCRVIQRLLEHSDLEQLYDMVELIISDITALTLHAYANYVVQHLLQHGTTPYQRHRLSRKLVDNYVDVSQDAHAAAVVVQVLQHGFSEEQRDMARLISSHAGVVATMAHTRYGHQALKTILQKFDLATRQELQANLLSDATSLHKSRYGRSVAACLRTEMAGATA